jgi:uncharacterized protein with FMN-binding domain
VLAGHALAPTGAPPLSQHAPTAPSTAKRPLVDGTATGPLIRTEYGPVQVRVTVVGGRLTDIAEVILPSEHEHSRWIDANLVPQLRRRVLTAQSAHVDAISGATYTSGGYLASLQGALDLLT